MKVGAEWITPERCQFRVWAPFSDTVLLHIVSPSDELVTMTKAPAGCWETVVHSPCREIRYFYRLGEGTDLPDPASRYQPEGIFGPSATPSDEFEWTDPNWFGIPLERYVIYELHVGTFSPEGTFEGVIPHLDRLRDLGIQAIELMPIAQFSGTRNWGYDGVFPYAVQHSYGGPVGFQRLVNACHQRGIAVVLDVVYNHLGPEGNVLLRFGPYFTDRYKTPWGAALNFDAAYSDQVRDFFIENALYWITDYHVDALRLDAVHAIYDHSAQHILEEITQRVHQRGTDLNRRAYVIGESALNDVRLIRPAELGGYGLDAQWNDDFHHAMHVLLTEEHRGYYADFGDFQHMAQAFAEGFVYSGRFSVSRKRRHGNSSRDIHPSKFVVYSKNHDQIGNRMLGERLSRITSIDSFKLAQAAVILSPYIPLIFMGEEYGESAPFLYFVDHSDPELIDAVRRGRAREFSDFNWASEPPDPQDPATFQRSILNHDLLRQVDHKALFDYHHELISLRRSLPGLRYLCKDTMDVRAIEAARTLLVRRWWDTNDVLLVFHFGGPAEVDYSYLVGSWAKLLDSADECWLGPGSTIPNQLDGSTKMTFSGPQAAVFIRQRCAWDFSDLFPVSGLVE
jgi:maltooligosyltrehalose trehalohydrolase